MTTRCALCNKRLTMPEACVGGCRCGSTFCSVHRVAEHHACGFDWRAEQRAKLAKEGMGCTIQAEKVPGRL